MTPFFVSLISTLLMEKSQESASSLASRSSTTRCLFLAIAGIITRFAISRSYVLSGTSMRSHNSTIPCECASLVVVLSITGVSYFSLISKASFIKSLASWESEGSSTGTWAALATILVSCSFCDEYMPGSSAATMTRPPDTPI